MSALSSIPAAPPRHYIGMPASPALYSAAVPPAQRRARIAARRAFVELKQRFMAAVATIDGSRGRWLRHQVRQTEAPLDLWLLRGAVFDALRAGGDGDHRTRHTLRDALDSAFPNSAFPAV
ncbi:hypothetical protein HLB44_17380 [Aquincola sp. S2]|uniref:Uncharacterized protein n=1 Tax=Pseudaquabacterium terrae TaxID=2732868 RepID=A0ABX2EJM0_9BURK|nr:hypothetical protein [Aquabacterium terrae]NRF68767.1 hypothetical protein [Aquabacterium terrae]